MSTRCPPGNAMPRKDHNLTGTPSSNLELRDSDPVQLTEQAERPPLSNAAKILAEQIEEGIRARKKLLEEVISRAYSLESEEEEEIVDDAEGGDMFVIEEDLCHVGHEEEVEQQILGESANGAAQEDITMRAKHKVPSMFAMKPASKRKRSTKVDDTPNKDAIVSSPRPIHYTSNGLSAKAPSEKAPFRSNIPKKRRKDTKTIYASIEVVDTSKRPEWYEDPDASGKKKFSRSDLDSIAAVKDMIESCVEQAKNDTVEKQFTILRNKIHTMEFYGFLKLPTAATLIKQSRILDDKGLQRIFSGPDSTIFPYDIRADAEMLWRRWVVKDFNPDLLRGIDTVKGVLAYSNSKRTNHSSQKDYEYKRPANVFGANGLVNGQWWPSRLCAMRDGAHGAIEAGIWGQTNVGAFAVCVSEGLYQDRDNGKVILYCGTQGENGEKSIGTKQLDETMRRGEPLRVLRSAKKDSKYAPEKGTRYDGLYEVRDSEILDSENVMVRFTLRRLEGQDPIRYRGDGARPTQQEKKEWSNIRKLVS